MKAIAALFAGVLLLSCSGQSFEERVQRSTPDAHRVVKHPKEARDTNRRTDLSAILSALEQYAIDHFGEYPEGIPSTLTEICKSQKDCTDMVDLSVLEGPYLVEIPVDSRNETARGTGYAIMLENGTVTVVAPKTESEAMLKISR